MRRSKQQEETLNDDEVDNEHLHDYFLSWCQDYLAIDTNLVEIDYFEYPDYLKAMEDRIDIFCDDCNDDDDEQATEYNSENEQQAETTNALHSLDENDRYLSVEEEYPPVSVRGLKASRDINVGEVVLSIPHSALWTVHNTIDGSRDSKLINAMGKEARKLHGWESPGMDDIPLLAITLLYHMDHYHNHDGTHDQLDYDRPHYGPYLDVLELQNLQDSIPHLWDSRKLRKSATPEVRKVAKGIRQDVVELYESIVQVLIQNHPDIFGNKYENAEHEDGRETGEWMFSLEKFHWAFALVNSRHWHLQIPDDPFAVENENPTEDTLLAPNADNSKADPVPAFPPEDDHETFTDQEGPPAATPTDEWVVIQDEKLREEEERESKQMDGKDSGEDVIDDYDYWPSGNSFLAPLADLLNFGPPCTRGIYNPESMAFEIIATCEFTTGQEITFWYTDACEDVFVANYGFTMPMMVPKCNEGMKQYDHANSNSLDSNQQHQQEYLESELIHAYQEMDRLDRRLDFLMNVLEECHCGNQTELLAGAWKYPNDKSQEHDKTNKSDAGHAGKPANISRSPSPPPRNSNKQKDSKKGPDAQHAIRDRRKSRKDSHQHHGHHQHAMTRVRSRSHGRGLDIL